ncbi:putative zinc finger protein R05D3.3 [Ditylenchus destructor]|nr:putative zinc finger protein R05D3.3 [Ditylenchus destructor]
MSGFGGHLEALFSPASLPSTSQSQLGINLFSRILTASQNAESAKFHSESSNGFLTPFDSSLASSSENIELRKALSKPPTPNKSGSACRQSGAQNVTNPTSIFQKPNGSAIVANTNLQQILPHLHLLDKDALNGLVNLVNLELLTASILQSGNPITIGLLQQSIKGLNSAFECINGADLLSKSEHNSSPSPQEQKDTRQVTNQTDADKSSPLRKLLTATASNCVPQNSVQKTTAHGPPAQCVSKEGRGEIEIEDDNSRVRKLTMPKISRHNDAAYYPNIQCILCNEWVCSRNRYMHIESHLQYRPYKCSICGYDNRKEIFINLHIKKAHGSEAVVVYTPDRDLEHRAWVMAEKCLQHTREVLSNKFVSIENDPKRSSGVKRNHPEVINDSTREQDSKTNENLTREIEDPLFQPYASQFRPKIYNSQRAEKSQIIEASRMQGLIPDLSDVSSRETKCELCDSYLLAVPSVMDEHVRMHLSAATFRCPIEDCDAKHHSKNFLVRHMKEVHKVRKSPIDLLDSDNALYTEFENTNLACFPHFNVKRRRRSVPIQTNIDCRPPCKSMPEAAIDTQTSAAAENILPVAKELPLPDPKNLSQTSELKTLLEAQKLNIVKQSCDSVTVAPKFSVLGSLLTRNKNA